jgi:hypothetical protein
MSSSRPHRGELGGVQSVLGGVRPQPAHGSLHVLRTGGIARLARESVVHRGDGESLLHEGLCEPASIPESPIANAPRVETPPVAAPGGVRAPLYKPGLRSTQALV